MQLKTALTRSARRALKGGYVSRLLRNPSSAGNGAVFADQKSHRVKPVSAFNRLLN